MTLDIKDVLRDLRASQTELEDLRGLLAAARDRITELVAERDQLERDNLDLIGRAEASESNRHENYAGWCLACDQSWPCEWAAQNRAAGLDGF